MERHNVQKIPPWTLGLRIFTEILLRPLLPRTIVDKNQALPKARRAAARGEGLIIVFTHFSLRDAMEVNRTLVYSDPILRDREVINPLAFHQYKMYMRLIGKFFHGTLVPIVNNSTLRKKGYEHLPKGKGLREFVSLSGNTLEKGGIVSLAVNATRSEKLDIEDPQKPVGYLVASLQAKGIKNYGLLLVGFSIKNASSYKKKEVGAFNFGKTYLMNIVGYYSLSELLNHPEVKAKVANIDHFIRKEISKVSPKEYL